MKRIFLVGYMGVGKTTLGRELAKSLNLTFIDLDQFIENRYNKTVAQLFAELGENKFREIENLVLKEVSTFEDVVISTGGGTPCFFDNIDTMLSMGQTIYLKTDIPVLFKRLNLCKAKRPLLKDKNDQELFQFISDNIKKRHPFYVKSHDIIHLKEFNKKQDIDEAVNSLVDIINNKKENESNI